MNENENLRARLTELALCVSTGQLHMEDIARKLCELAELPEDCEDLVSHIRNPEKTCDTCARYKLDRAAASGKKAHELLEAVAKKRGFLLSGGVIDTERAAAIVLDEFRGGKIGRISLEAPASAEKKESLTPDTENRDILEESVPAPAVSSAEKLESASICTACEAGDSVNKNTETYAMPDNGEGER